MRITRRPIVIIPACNKHVGEHSSHITQHKYIEAVLSGADCMPMILPAIGDRVDSDALLALADGILLTGSSSNVHPRHFDQTVHDPRLPLDVARDATTLPLILSALRHGVPLLAICRGFQEVNVAMGGSLHQAVHEVAGFMDHRDIQVETLEEQYAARHAVTLHPDGKLSRILGGVSEIMVNSLHGQGIARLAPGLVVEAWAPDGLVEAYSLAHASESGFCLAVQWHPEWQFAENPDSSKLFAAFGLACREFQSRRKN